MYIPQSPYTRIALESIKYHLGGGSVQELDFKDVPPALYTIKRGCFVSVHKLDDELRGCIGTLEPHEQNLVLEIRRNAVSAAFNDQRFHPLTEEELPDIKLSVDVLTEPERIHSSEDLDPMIYGLIISDGKFQRGVLLPALPGVESIEKQIQVVKQKAGLSDVDNSRLEFYRFSSTRYH